MDTFIVMSIDEPGATIFADAHWGDKFHDLYDLYDFSW